MALYVTITSATGVNGPIEIPAGFFADNSNPTPLQVAAEFTRRMQEDTEKAGLPAGLGFRAPLSILVEEI